MSDLVVLEPTVLPFGPVEAYLARLHAVSGRRSQRSALERVARILTGGTRDARSVAWERLTHADLLVLRETLARRYRPISVNTMLAAVRGVLRAAFQLGLVDGDTIARIADVKGLPVSELPTGRALSLAERVALVEAAEAQEDRALACRDAALIALLLATGARIDEATQMATGDVDGDRVVIRHAKGGLGREVPLPPKTAVRLAEWLALRAIYPGDRLWLSVGFRSPQGRPLSGRSCYQRVASAGERAGFLVTPHDLRRTYATTILGEGADPLLVAKLLGHRDVRTTQRYDRRALDVARGFLGVLDV